MGQAARIELPAVTVFRVLLGLVALDGIAFGLWALLRPGDLFQWFQLPDLPADGPRDRLLLWTLLGGLNVTQAALTALAAWRPVEWGSLALAPLIGRLLGCGVWLFLLGTDRIDVPDGPLVILTLHDAVGAAILAAFLIHFWVSVARFSREGK
jgi:hypothetical protein